MLWAVVDQEVRITPTGPASGAGATQFGQNAVGTTGGSPGINRSDRQVGNAARGNTRDPSPTRGLELDVRLGGTIGTKVGAGL